VPVTNVVLPILSFHVVSVKMHYLLS